MRTFQPERVLKARKNLNLSQHELAARAGVSPTTIVLMERGKKIPLVNTFIKVADALELSPGYFFK